MNRTIDIPIQKWKQLPRVSQKDNGASNAANELGINMNDVFKNTEATTDTINELAKAVSGLSDSFGGANRAAAQIFKEIQGVQQGLIDASEATFVFEKRNAKLIRGLGISNGTAQQFGTIIDGLSSKYQLNSDDLKKYTQDVNQFFGGTSGFLVQGIKDGNVFADQMIVINDALQTQYGLTEDQANQFQTYAMSAGVSGMAMFDAFQKTADEIETATGQTGVLKEMMDGISQVSAQNQLTFGRYPGQLALAAVQANRLGTSFDNIAAAGEKSLNIESSVASELEYQLLTGTKLEKNGQNLLNNLRQATVYGDATDMAKAYGDILDVMGPLNEMNLLQQNAAADALGISREELAVQYQRKEARAEMLEQLGQLENRDDLIKLMDEGEITKVKKQLEELGKSELAESLTALQDPNSALKSSQDILTDSINSLTSQIVALYNDDGTIEALATERINFIKEQTGNAGKLFSKIDNLITLMNKDGNVENLAGAAGDALLMNDLVKNSTLLNNSIKDAATGLTFFASIFDNIDVKSILNKTNNL